MRKLYILHTKLKKCEMPWIYCGNKTTVRNDATTSSSYLRWQGNESGPYGRKLIELGQIVKAQDIDFIEEQQNELKIKRKKRLGNSLNQKKKILSRNT